MIALIALEQYGSIEEEDMVLVNVGLGGIGLSAVDIAAHIFRAKVGFYNMLLLVVSKYCKDIKMSL